MDSDGFLRPGFLSLRFFAQTAPGFVHRVAMIARKRQRSSKLKLQRPQREASPLVRDSLPGDLHYEYHGVAADLWCSRD